MPQRLRESSGRRAFAAIPIDAPDLPEDVLALLDQYLLDLGGTYGDPNAGDPFKRASAITSPVLDGFTMEAECPPSSPGAPRSLRWVRAVRRAVSCVLDLG